MTVIDHSPLGVTSIQEANGVIKTLLHLIRLLGGSSIITVEVIDINQRVIWSHSFEVEARAILPDVTK